MPEFRRLIPSYIASQCIVDRGCDQELVRSNRGEQGYRPRITLNFGLLQMPLILCFQRHKTCKNKLADYLFLLIMTRRTNFSSYVSSAKTLGRIKWLLLAMSNARLVKVMELISSNVWTYASRKAEIQLRSSTATSESMPWLATDRSTKISSAGTARRGQASL